MKKILSALLYLSLTATIVPAQEPPVNLSLEQAITTALEQNLGLRLKKQEIMAAQGGAEIAQGAFDPLVIATGFHGESRDTSFATGATSDEQTTGWSASLQKKIDSGAALDLTWENLRYDSDQPLVIDPAYSSSLSVGVTQPLLKGWGRDIQTATIQSSEKLVAAAGEAVTSEAVDLGSAVATAYWELLFAHQNMEVKKLSLALAGKLLDNAAKKIEAGILAPVEIYQPESEVARREQALIEGERVVALAEDSLKLMLNREDWETTLMPIDHPEVGKSQAELKTVLDHALAGRPDLRAAERKVEATEIVAVLADDSLRPSLDLSGRMGLTGTDESYGNSIGEVTTSSDLAWQLGVTFTLPLNNRSAKGGLLTAQANLEMAKTTVDLLRQDVIRTAREAVRNEHLALKNIEASRKTALALQKRLEAEENKFEVGLSTALDVLEAQEAYAQGLIGQKRALIDYALAQVELNRVQGIILVK
ncbi:MAG: TolC family protein [Proteobacteria bacterium]|nr:TolC family protein [Pseudomonadota bacterium]MBU1688393.1 TolC family protein [Pseudomonadota bacterium]